MALQEMIKDLEEQAREAGEKILADARVNAKKILEEAEKEGEELCEESLNRVKQNLEVEKAKILGSANFYVQKRIIKTKEQIIGELFSKLGKTIEKELNSGSQEAIFKELADEALSKIKSQKIKVFVNGKDKALAKKLLADNGLDYQLQDNLKSIGGLKVESEDGRIAIDNTIETRLQKIRQFYEPIIIANLFGDRQ